MLRHGSFGVGLDDQLEESGLVWWSDDSTQCPDILTFIADRRVRAQDRLLSAFGGELGEKGRCK